MIFEHVFSPVEYGEMIAAMERLRYSIENAEDDRRVLARMAKLELAINKHSIQNIFQEAV